MTFDWAEHRKHRRQVVADHGRWIGLLDGNGQPICTLPSKPVELQAPQQRMGIGSLKMTISVGSKWGTKHPALRALIDDTLGQDSASGAIVPTKKTRFVCIETAGKRRVVWRVGQRGTTQLGDTLTIHAVDTLSYLQQLPCISQPAKWKQKDAWFTADTDWLAVVDASHKFRKPRQIREIDFSTSLLADNVLAGPADEVIHKVLSESLEAFFVGVERKQKLFCAQPQGDSDAPYITLKPSDGWLWQEISPRASAAGVTLRAGMWLPGDGQPAGLELDSPSIVIDVVRDKEV